MQLNTLRLAGLLAVAASIPYLLSSVGLRRISSLVFEDVEARHSDYATLLEGVDLSINKNASATAVGGVRKRPWESSVIDQTNQTTPPKDPRIYLIHIGKCGGVTTMQTLGRGSRGKELECRMKKRSTSAFDDDCRRITPGQSTLSRRIIGRYHVGSPTFSRDEKEWLLADTDTFLYLIRDPLDRARSAFEYHKHTLQEEPGQSPQQYKRGKNQRFYVDCFPGRFNDMVEAIRGSSPDEDCKGFALDALSKGSRVAGNHFFYNYQKYRKFSLGGHPSHSVMVIRTEHLWDDMIRLDKRLGGDGYFVQEGAKRTHGSESYAPDNSTFIAPENSAYLCCVMYGEIEVYQELILKAVNLNDDEKRGDLVKVMRHCQMDVADGGVDLSAPFSWQEFGKGADCRRILS